MKKHILIVEDEVDIREMLRFGLENEGYVVTEAENAIDARQAIVNQSPDLLLVDWMMPQQSGIEFVRQLRRDKHHQNLPALFLTARSSEEDKIMGLNAGADDYMTKPVSMRELVARIQALLRRSEGFDANKNIHFENLTIDTAAHRLTIDKQAVKIGGTEYKLLAFFMTHPERVYSRPQLLDQVWGHDVYVDERTVDVHILRLRKLLKPHNADKMIQTVRGAGYRLSKTT